MLKYIEKILSLINLLKIKLVKMERSELLMMVGKDCQKGKKNEKNIGLLIERHLRSCRVLLCLFQDQHDSIILFMYKVIQTFALPGSTDWFRQPTGTGGFDGC